MKKLLLFVCSLTLFLSFNLRVSAASLVGYSFMARTFPSNIQYSPNETKLHTSNYFTFNGSDNIPNYVYIKTCGTGYLNNISIPYSSPTNAIDYVTQYSYGSCNVDGYSGKNYVYVFSINAVNDAGNGNYGLTYNLSTTGMGYTTIIDLNSMSFSDSLSFDDALVSGNDTIINQNQTIINQNNQTNQNLENINDSIVDLNSSITDSDTSGANSDAENFFSGFSTDTFGLTSIITSPLNLIGSITSSSCSPLGLPLPYVNKSLTLPCMGSIYEEHFGSFLDLYQSITFGIVAYWVCVRIFNLVKDFKNPEHDEIEVLDL